MTTHRLAEIGYEEYERLGLSAETDDRLDDIIARELRADHIRMDEDKDPSALEENYTRQAVRRAFREWSEGK